MGRCANCPFYTGYVAANEIVSEFAKDAIDNARKPGHELRKRAAMFLKAFEHIEDKINCTYLSNAQSAPLAELKPSEPEPDNDADTVPISLKELRTLDEQKTLSDRETEVYKEPPINLAALLSQLAAAPNNIKACQEPLEAALNTLTLNNGVVWVHPDGHYENDIVRQSNAKDQQSSGGKYL